MVLPTPWSNNNRSLLAIHHHRESLPVIKSSFWTSNQRSIPSNLKLDHLRLSSLFDLLRQFHHLNPTQCLQMTPAKAITPLITKNKNSMETDWKRKTRVWLSAITYMCWSHSGRHEMIQSRRKTRQLTRIWAINKQMYGVRWLQKIFRWFWWRRRTQIQIKRVHPRLR